MASTGAIKFARWNWRITIIQLAGYLRILDDEVRKPNENPSIGIILCKSANKKFVEYVIQDYNRPMGVATYKTSADMDDKLKKLLPPVDALERLL